MHSNNHQGKGEENDEENEDERDDDDEYDEENDGSEDYQSNRERLKKFTITPWMKSTEVRNITEVDSNTNSGGKDQTQ